MAKNLVDIDTHTPSTHTPSTAKARGFANALDCYKDAQSDMQNTSNVVASYCVRNRATLTAKGGLDGVALAYIDSYKMLELLFDEVASDDYLSALGDLLDEVASQLTQHILQSGLRDVITTALDEVASDASATPSTAKEAGIDKEDIDSQAQPTPLTAWGGMLAQEAGIKEG